VTTETTATTDTGTTTEKVETTVTTTDTGTTTIAGGAGDTGKTADTTTTTTTETPPQPSWRDQMAGEDKQFRTRLERFKDPTAFAQSYRSLETKLSSGEYKKALPEGATAEETATWRKENGIPDKADAYLEKLALPNGIVTGEEDKPILADFATLAHGKNWTPGQFNEAVSWYFETQNKQVAAQQAADRDYMTTAEEQLHTSWGADYRANKNVIGSVRDSMPESLQSRLMSGRTADGKMIGNDPEFLNWIVQVGREMNPAATLLPAGTTDPNKGVDAELAAIRELRRNDPDKYDQDKKLQAREIELLDAQSKLKARAA